MPNCALAFLQGAGDALDHRAHRNAARGVGLRIEEDFAVHHAVGASAIEVGLRQGMEVGFVAQHVRARVVEIEEGLQVLEVIGAAQGFDRIETERHAVLLRECERHLGLQRAFKVEMQFRLGQRRMKASRSDLREDEF